MVGSQEPKRVVAKSIPTKNKQSSKRELWARICYHYPQYDLKSASLLSIRDIRLLLNTARKIEMEKYSFLTQIAAAPHTEKGKGVKQLTEYFSRESK